MLTTDGSWLFRYGGEWLTLKELLDKFRVMHYNSDVWTLRKRLARNWSVERAMSEEIRPYYKEPAPCNVASAK